MIIAITCLVAVAVIAFILWVRPADLPKPEPVSPFERLDERKVAIYENLRDLQFEYRLGKLSDQDYQSTKKGLQKELAAVLADVDLLKAQLSAPRSSPPPRKPAGFVCPSCGAAFHMDIKFCGMCGKPMQVAQ